MDNPRTYEVNIDRTNRAGLIFSAVMEMLGVSALAIYAAYHEYWPLVGVATAYVLYVTVKLRYNLRKARAKAVVDSAGEVIGEPGKEEPQVGGKDWRSQFKLIKSTPSQRKLAGILALVYCALFALGFYLESIDIEDFWPVWALWVGGVLGFGTLLVLPFVVVVLFFGIDVSYLRRFSLRGMLRTMFWASLFIWYGTQMNWVIQRQQWRITNGAAMQSEGPAPPVLRMLMEPGVSRIEMKSATKEQVDEAKRLFPEATVVAAENSPVGGSAAPAVVPVQPQPTVGN